MSLQDLTGEDHVGTQEAGPWSSKPQQRCLCPNGDTEAAEPQGLKELYELDTVRFRATQYRLSPTPEAYLIH